MPPRKLRRSRNDRIIAGAIVLAVVIIVLALWFKGGEFFCRLRGGGWDPHHELCHTPD